MAVVKIVAKVPCNATALRSSSSTPYLAGDTLSLRIFTSQTLETAGCTYPRLLNGSFLTLAGWRVNPKRIAGQAKRGLLLVVIIAGCTGIWTAEAISVQSVLCWPAGVFIVNEHWQREIVTHNLKNDILELKQVNLVWVLVNIGGFELYLLVAKSSDEVQRVTVGLVGEVFSDLVGELSSHSRGPNLHLNLLVEGQLHDQSYPVVEERVHCESADCNILVIKQ